MNVSPNDFVICPRFTTLRIPIPFKYIIRVRRKKDLIELLINYRNKCWQPLQCSRAPELFQEICKALQRYALENAPVPVQPKLSLVNAARPSHRGTTAASNGEGRNMGRSAIRLPLQPTDVDAGYETAWNFTAPPKPPVGSSSFKGTLQSESSVGNSMLAAQNGQVLVPHASNEEDSKADENDEYEEYGTAWNLSELQAIVATDDKKVVDMPPTHADH